MRGRLLVVIIVTLWVTLGVALRAGPARADEDPQTAGGMHVAYSHKNQLGVYVQGGLGYRLLVRYDSSVYCGQAGKSVCTSSSPPFVELGLSYGLSSSVELLTDLRFALADDFVPDGSTGKAPHPFAISPGVKLYIDDQGSVKWFTTFQIAFDLTDYQTDGTSGGADVGLRNVNGLLIDLHRTFGIYFHIGETIAFVRWARFELDGGIGLQARFP